MSLIEMNASSVQTGAIWQYSVPWGMKKLLEYIRINYDNPLVFITENGMHCETFSFFLSREMCAIFEG